MKLVSVWPTQLHQYGLGAEIGAFPAGPNCYKACSWGIRSASVSCRSFKGNTVRGYKTRSSERKMALREGLWEGAGRPLRGTFYDHFSNIRLEVLSETLSETQSETPKPLRTSQPRCRYSCCPFSHVYLNNFQQMVSGEIGRGVSPDTLDAVYLLREHLNNVHLMVSVE